MKVIVTGSRGLVGSAVVQAARSEGWQVLEADRRDGREARALVHEAALPGGIDAILHCGSPGNIHAIAADRISAADDHCAGTVAAVEAAGIASARAVLASSWEVYSGGPEPVTEETGVTRPSHFYGALKLSAEQLAFTAGAEIGVEVIALRLGTVWASTGRRQGVIPLFLDRALSGKPLKVQGEPFRQFVRVEDVAHAFVRAASQPSPSVVNIVGDEVIGILDIAKRIARQHGVAIEQTEARTHDAESLVISSALAGEALGWEPSRSFWEWLDHELDTSTG